MSGVAIIARQNRCMRAFEQAGATSPESARSLKQLELSRSPIFFLLVAHGVMIDVGSGRYYIDLAAAEEFRKRRRKRILIWVGGAVLVTVAILLLR